MGPRGKHVKGKHKQKFKQFKRKPLNKARTKKFNIHKIKSQKSLKRSYDETTVYSSEKRQKTKEPQQPQIEDSSTDEDDQENHMKQLLSTFNSNLINKKVLAIDSSSDNSESEEEENILEVLDDNPEISDNNDDEEDEVRDCEVEELGDSEDDNAKDSEDDNAKDSEEDESKDSEDDEAKDSEDDESEGSEEQDEVNLEEIDETSNNKVTLEQSNSHQENVQESFEEEEEENEEDAETQKEDESKSDLLDPFARHLFFDIDNSLLNSVQSVPMATNVCTEDWPVLGKLHVQIPICAQEEIENKYVSLLEKIQFAPKGSIPARISKTNQTLDSAFIKTQIIGNISRANKCDNKVSQQFPLSSLQSEIFSVINNYQDFFYPNRTFENAEEIRFVYSLHVVNHILKTRTKVLHHNARLSKKDEVPEEFRDQGLVRPKILIIVPFRDAAYKIICMLIDILIPENKGNVMNKSRFLEEFTGHELVMPKKNPKPEDYEMLFSGNTGDDFRIGITVTKKSLKLFAEFYSSDIIIASPLGLRTIIGGDGETERDYDFLASVELLILDQTEIFTMQNWDHLLHVMNHMHLQPKDSHGTDFSRVRTWSLNGWAKYYRQTLIFSSIVLPDINAIFNKKCFNYAGRVKIINPIETGSICQVLVQLPHVFHKFSVDSVSESMDARFKFFITKILPQQRDVLMKQTLIFVSSYFDYVRLRNYFKKEDVNFVQICEYSKEGKVARARDMFFHGDAHFVLYTERYHFFNRVRVKGIRHLVFYQPPVFPNFYSEMCNLMQESNMNKKIGSVSNMTVTVLYSKYDIHQLAAIVGTDRAARMIQSDRNVHMLVTDGK